MTQARVVDERIVRHIRLKKEIKRIDHRQFGNQIDVHSELTDLLRKDEPC